MTLITNASIVDGLLEYSIQRDHLLREVKSKFYC